MFTNSPKSRIPTVDQQSKMEKQKDSSFYAQYEYIFINIISPNLRYRHKKMQ